MPDCQRLGGLSQRGLPTLQSSGALTTRERFARDDVPVYPRGAVTALDTDAREQRFRDSSDCAEDPILNAFTAYDRSMITPVRKRNFSARPGKGDPGPAQRERAGRNEHKMLSLPKMSAVERQDSCDWGHRPKSL